MIGRESGDVILDDPETSALHAEIEFTKGAVIVRDLGSRNGTWREGQRLPQFALYRGQSFRCGTTEITLVDVDGSSAPVAGGTAAGNQRVDDQVGQSSSTLPSASSMTTAQTVVRGLVFPPSSGTEPGPTQAPEASIARVEDSTLVGMAPPPATMVAPTAASPVAAPPQPAAPGPDYVPPANVTLPFGVPGLVADAPSAPVAVPGMPTPGMPTPGMPAPGMPVPGMPVPGMPAPGMPVPGMPAPAASSAPPGVPAPVPAASSAPLGVPAPVPAASSAPLGVPSFVAAAPSAPLAPVANAVIKLGDASPKAAKARPTVDRAARARLWKRVLVGSLVVAVVGGLVGGLYALLSGRNHAFLRELAGELPSDAVGVVAISSPRAVIELFGTELPPEVRSEATKALGLDPLDVATLEGFGLDADAPLGVGLLDGTGTLTVSAGVADPATLRAALSTKLAAAIKAKEDLRWIERSFGDVPGLWLDEPMSVAALLPGKRVIFVLGGDADAVARQAKRVAEAKQGETLADRPAFGELEPVPGKLLVAAYADGAGGRAALPGKGFELVAMRMALADLEGLAVLLSDDGPRVHLSTQTIMREDTSSLPALADVRRKSDLLDRIPAPALAEFDAVFAPGQLGAVLGGGVMRWGMALGFEDEFRTQTGLDLRADVLDNLDGQFGWVLQALPAKDQRGEHVTALGFAGVKDQEAAKRAAERFFGKMQGELELQLEQVEGTTVYVHAASERDPKVSFFVHGNAVFLALGNADVAAIIKGSGEPFRRKARIPAIEEATSPGGQAAGFLDIRELLTQVRARLSTDDLADLDRWSPVVSPLEALTMRTELDDHTFVVLLSLHTSSEHALAALVRGTVELAGAELATELGIERRRERCEALVDHIYDLMKAELNVAEELMDQRYTMLEECRKPDTTDAEIDCMMQVKALEGLGACEDRKTTPDGPTPIDTIDQPEPTPVPYVDDIWPYRSAAGTATGKPDPQVSYAVPLGDDPAVRGPADALVTVVMFGDFQCPHCKRVLPTLDQLLASDREVRLVFRNNPLAMHTEAEIAARAALAAGKQGKFWEMHDKLYDNQHALSEASFRLWAGELGLDLVRFDRDYADSTTAEHVRADVALAKRFGATGTPAFFVNGRYLGGAQPLHAFQAVVTEEKERAERFVDRRGKTRKRLYDDMISHFAPEVVTGTPTPVGTPVGEKRYSIDTAGLPRRGGEGFVRVEIVECGDLDCPFCKRAETTLDTVLADYGSKVALFWLHNPLSFHAGAEPAARAATAAGKQGKFWEMQDKLFEDVKRRSESDLIGYARDLGLDVAQFEADLRDPATAEQVREQAKRCTDNDARGTPTFFINGRIMGGAQPIDKFKEIIDQELSGGI